MKQNPSISTDRQVAFIVKPHPENEAPGVDIGRSIGNGTLVMLDPLMLCDHLIMEGPDDQPKGFPKHPHRGIETLTWVVQGKVDHRDSMGNTDTVFSRGSQWMTAGKGIYHAEMFTPQDGRCEALQLWFNLPADKKHNPPAYQSADPSDIPTTELPSGVKVGVVAGTFQDLTGPFQGIAVDPTILALDLPAGSTITLPTDQDQTACLYVFNGQPTIGPEGNEKEIESPALLPLTSGTSLTIKNNSNQPSHILFVQARPLKEQVLQYRSLVMTTVDQMKKAVDDLKNKTFVEHEDKLQMND